MITLKEFPLFAGLTDRILDPLEKNCRWKSFAAGETIVHCGDKDIAVYFLRSGAARKEAFSESGMTISLGMVRTGEYFGEEFDGHTVPYDVVAIKACSVVVMPNSTFEEALCCSAVMARILDKMARDIRDSHRRIETMKDKVADRVEDVLRSRAVNGIVEIISHNDVAASVISTRESVARSISEMIQSGVLRKISNTRLEFV